MRFFHGPQSGFHLGMNSCQDVVCSGGQVSDNHGAAVRSTRAKALLDFTAVPGPH